MLAMHMANELLSIPVAAITLIVSAVVVALSARRSSLSLVGDKAPLMGVIGAFVFAAQMINFTLPGMPGTSGHLGGGVLLAILLGPAAAIVTMAGILIVQCLLFQDGGLLALGCNIINMGIVPCLLGWGVYRLLIGKDFSPPSWRQYLSAWAGCTVGVAGGAAMVPFQATLSGVLRIPTGDFLAVMIGVHLLIGFIEGAITFAVIAYLRQVRPSTLGLSAPQSADRLSRKAVLASILATAILLGGVVSWFASTHSDGLEWSYLERPYSGKAGATVENTSPSVAAVDSWQGRWSLMSDYTRRAAPLGQELRETEKSITETAASWPNLDGWSSLAGILGTVVTLAVVYGASAVIRRRRKVLTVNIKS